MGRVESQIHKVEGFKVNIRYGGTNQRDVDDRKENVPGYRWENAAPGTWTVAEWREKRFSDAYPGYTAEVLDGDDRAAEGRMLLRNVRAGY